MGVYFNQLEEQEILLADKMSFLSKKIMEEQAKGTVYIKRFKNMTELCEFETKLAKEAPDENVQNFDDLLPPVSEDEQFKPTI